MTSRSDRRRLLTVGREIAGQLRDAQPNRRLRIRSPRGVGGTNTDGWSVVIGDLGPNTTRLEVWLDRFSGHTEREFFVCFRSEDSRKIARITNNVAKTLWPVRTITNSDIGDEKYFRLEEPLKRQQYNVPVLEKYAEGRTFYGLYDARKGDTAPIVERASAFFEVVLRHLPSSGRLETLSDERDTYPHAENRQTVAAHLRRERSKFLALECKRRDKFTCQVCDFQFEKRYGSIGLGYAEAHHRRALSSLKGEVRTKLEDLVTVCSNCHRMLHRMRGVDTDVRALRASLNRIGRRT